jgi:tetratricopeptide (TPR) repeat protein
MGHHAKAINHYKESINYDNSNPETYLNLGAIYEALKKYKDAEAAFKVRDISDFIECPPN